jgi:hypothetical protein
MWVAFTRINYLQNEGLKLTFTQLVPNNFGAGSNTKVNGNLASQELFLKQNADTIQRLLKI